MHLGEVSALVCQQVGDQREQFGLLRPGLQRRVDGPHLALSLFTGGELLGGMFVVAVHSGAVVRGARELTEYPEQPHPRVRTSEEVEDVHPDREEVVLDLLAVAVDQLDQFPPRPEGALPMPKCSAMSATRLLNTEMCSFLSLA